MFNIRQLFVVEQNTKNFIGNNYLTRTLFNEEPYKSYKYNKGNLTKLGSQVVQRNHKYFNNNRKQLSF